MGEPKKLVGHVFWKMALVGVTLVLSGCASSDAARRLGEPMPTRPVIREHAEGEHAGGGLVTIYGVDWCEPCHDAASFLAQRGVPYVERNIDADHDANAEMQEKLREAGLHVGSIPVLDVKGHILVGFSPQAVSRALSRPAL